MTHTDKKNTQFILVIGVLFLTTYFLMDFLWDKIWIFSVVPLGLFSLSFVVLFILAITSKNRTGKLIGIVVIGTICISELVTSEIFKSDRILEATLMDDLSAIRLTLRANNKFEVVSSNMFNEEIFTGNYMLLKDKIIFKDKRYDNDFIPDTLTIIGDKIIIRFDEEGKPITTFANYFEIKRNK